MGRDNQDNRRSLQPEMLQGIVDSAMDAIISIDDQHRIVLFNAAAEQMFGYQASDVIGGPLDRLLPSRLRDVHTSHIAQFANTGITQRSMRSPGTLMALRADGQEFPIEATISQVVLPKGRAFTVILRDITLRKSSEEKLRLSEEKFAKAFANNPSAIAITRLEEGTFLDVNDTWVGLVGHSREEAIGRSARSMRIWPSEDAARRFVEELRHNGSLRGWEQQFVNKAGEVFVAQLSAQVLQMGEADVVISTLVDITERKRAERELAEKARLLDLSSDAIFVRDASDRIVYWNRSATQMYGFNTDEALGRAPHELLRTEFPRPQSEILAVLQENGYWNGELIHSRKDGHRLTVSSRWSLDRDAHGKARAVLETNRDITESKLAQEALITSEKLASVGRMAATVSHEINNPLTIVANAVFLAAQDKGLSPQSKEYLEEAEKELERVAQLTRQTLGFYREANSPDEFDLDALVENVIAIYRPKLVDRDITILFRGSRHHLRAVAGEIRQVLSNLLANAIDASPVSGRIIIRTTRVHLRSRPSIRLTIADTGEGVPAENVPRIFEPFFTTKQSRGTGLGLWVTNQIIERHGGSLRIRSRLGRGTVFCAFFPLEQTKR